MNKISYVYSKYRKDFGRQPLFTSVTAHMIDSIAPNTSEEKKYCLRNPVNRAVQATLPQSENDANTNLVILHNISVDHSEGGWPKDVNLLNEEHVSRHRRRVLHEENYIHTIKSISPMMEHYIDQNNAIDIYHTYFADMPQQNPVESYQIRMASSYADELNRPIACIAWTHEAQAKMAVAYSYRNPSITDLSLSDTCYLWDVERQNIAAHYLQPTCPCWCLSCSPVEPSVIVGGLQDGTVCMFDIRSMEDPVGISWKHVSHRDPVTSVLYSHSRTNTEIFSSSSDGQCLWWDIRKLSEPINTIPICVRISPTEKPHLGNSEGVSCLQFDHNLPTRFLCGTESGLVVNVNRLGRDYSEIITSHWDAHTGPVHAVQRSPCTTRMFLSCGDWSVKIWSEEVHMSPIIYTEPYQYQLSDVAWAPLRWSSYMSVCVGGFFYYWDILRKYHEPVAKLKVSTHELHKVTPHEDGRLVATGDSNGKTCLLHLSETMVWPSPFDKQLVQQTYERERRREHMLEARIKEIRLKARFEDEMGAAPPPEEEDVEEVLEAAEKEYWKVVNIELERIDSVF